MGFGRNLAKGLGDAAQILGAGITRDEAIAREDERLKKADEFKERELSMREKSNELSMQNQKLQLEMNQAKKNHSDMVKTYMTTGGDSAAMAQALTKNMNNGLVYRPLEEDTRKNGGVPVWEVGTYITRPDGSVEPGPDGKPQFERLMTDGGIKKFADKDEYTNFLTNVMNPDGVFARQLAKETAETQRQRDKRLMEQDLEKARRAAAQAAGTDKGKADLDATKANADLARAKAEKLRAEKDDPKGGSSATAKIREQGFNQFAKSLSTELGVAVSADTAKKVASITDNDKVREKFLGAVNRALDPNDGITRSDFIESGVKQGIPKAFMERLYRTAEESYSERSDEADIGSNQWFGGLVDKVLRVFTD